MRFVICDFSPRSPDFKALFRNHLKVIAYQERWALNLWGIAQDVFAANCDPPGVF
jgi:hypothetical protein